ncbi:MAG TPA: hypothetical protein VHC97_09250 [Thermoanaerobaculia bacterium]|jgi:hypothetical protein|nr:hypothetical protein [Thermoanaerobaculia bacterium]
MKPAESKRRKPRFDTQVPAGLIAGLLLAAALLLWSLGPQPSAGRPSSSSAPRAPAPAPVSAPADPAPAPAPAEPEPAGCPRGCETPPPDCEIKGNISLRTGERIYHLPGQQYYDKTVIDPAAGERWFCTEAEARANGWRKSKR